MIQWLQGKKTYIGALILAAAAIFLYFTGKMDVATLTMVLGAAIMIAGLGAKLQRFLPGIVQLLQDVKNKNATALVTDGAQIATTELTQGVAAVPAGPSVVVNVHTPAAAINTNQTR